MKVRELLEEGMSTIEKNQARMLLSYQLGYTNLEILNHLDEEVSVKNIEIYRKNIDELLIKKPIQYVLGTVNFYGNTFKVNKNVLIPRFETEELVENTLHYIKNYLEKPIKVLDLGCGSGVIGLTLKKYLPNIDVTLVDISEEALKVAKENAKSLNIEANFLKSDFLEQIEGTYDVIVSNPPYIRNDEEIDSMVKNNEPHLALYGGDDGLDCYRSILSNIKPHLKDKFLLAFEIGYEQKEQVEALIKQYLDDVEIITKKDLQGRNRMVFVFKNLV